MQGDRLLWLCWWCVSSLPPVYGIVSVPVPRKLLLPVSIDGFFTSTRGCTATLGSFAKVTFDDISKTYIFMSPDLWKETVSLSGKH